MAKTLIVKLEAQILDELNCQAPAVQYALVDPSATFSDVLSTVNTWLAGVDACTDGQILSVRLDVQPALPDGLKSAAVAGSRVEQVGLLEYVATGTTHVQSYPVPALSNGATVIAAGAVVTTSGSPAANLVALVAGGGTASMEWTTPWQQAISAFHAALISFRSGGSQLARDTYERL